MNTAIKNILLRNSHRELAKPYPSPDEMELVYKAALRAPDHAWLKPTRFIQITGSGIDKLSQIFVQFAQDHLQDTTAGILEKYKQAPFRAPMIIVLIAKVTDHPKVPITEQMLSTAAAGENILLALNALNYGAIWRTGSFALNDEIGKYLGLEDDHKVLGYIYVGTPIGKPKKLPDRNISDHLTIWE